MRKILWVKFGWSELYRGGPVDGDFSWLHDTEQRENEKRGYEACNFLPGPDGTYYCYVPPQKKEHAAYHDDPEGWTVVCFAKNPDHKGVHIVGWYENATLYGDWLPRPAHQGEGGPPPTQEWLYCISAKKAFFVPPDARVMPFSHTSVRQGKYSFLAGPDVAQSDNKRAVLAIIDKQVKALAGVAIENPDSLSLPDPETDSADPLKGFGTAEHRKAVEKKAEDVVIAHYARQGFAVQRVTHLPCGYDFIFTKGKKQVHVEVKGTAGAIPKFYLTRNEHVLGMQNNPAWRLAMVTSALTETPKLVEYGAAELARSFDLEPYVYTAKFVPESKDEN